MSRFFPRTHRLAPIGVFLLVLCLGMAAPGRTETDTSPQALARFFQRTTRSLPSPGIDFQVVTGFAVLQTGNPESSGRYAMSAINVTRVATNIYRLDLRLEKPQPRDLPSLDPPYFYTLERTYYFWYRNGPKIIFKVGNKRITLSTGRKDILRVDIHSPDTYSIDRETMLRLLQFRDGPDTYVLQIRFR